MRTTSFHYLGYWEPWARLALAVGIAAASFYLIEIPFNRLKRKFAMDATQKAPGFKPYQKIETTETSPAIEAA